MINEEQKQRAIKFLNLHRAEHILILPNVWDVASARIFELEGFNAIGTTSAGISSTLGYPDGQKMSLEESLEVTKRIVRHVDIPVSADFEAGYSDSINGLVQSVKEVIKTGVVGINLEDSTGDKSNPLFDISFQCERISAIREASKSIGIHLVLNARTDVFLESASGKSNKIKDTFERANRYKEAGADCIFVPDLGDFNKQIITELKKGIELPLNIIAGANTPSINELDEIGISRLSFGPRAMRATFDLLKNIAGELKNEGTYNLINNCKTTYSEVNGWFDNSNQILF